MVGLELERTIDSIMADLGPYMRTIFKELATTNPENASILSDFIIAEQNEQNIAETTTEQSINGFTKIFFGMPLELEQPSAMRLPIYEINTDSLMHHIYALLTF